MTKYLNRICSLNRSETSQSRGKWSQAAISREGTFDKTDATSPTAALESVLLTYTIDAKEGRDVNIIDIPNASLFPQTLI